MISKETFCNIAYHIEDMELMSNDMNTVFNMHTTNDFFDGAAFVDFELIDLTIKAIEEMFYDENGWISWWMYETKYGTDAEMCQVTVEDKEFCLNSAEALYDFLYNKVYMLAIYD